MFMEPKMNYHEYNSNEYNDYEFNYILRKERGISLQKPNISETLKILNIIENSTISHLTDQFFRNSKETNFLNFIYSNFFTTFTGFLFYSLTIWTIIGNTFVGIAILTNKQLKQGGMSNFLIGNLALSDLLLGLTVLPFSATLSTFKTWLFGKLLCDLWLSIDVLCSTASIWGLLVISLDRYIATNHPIRYRKQKNSIIAAIFYCTISWIISISISLGPLIFVSAEKESGLRQVENSTEFECVLFQTPSFVILSSLLSFYLPLVLMFVLYARVFSKIRQQSKMFQCKPVTREVKASTVIRLQSNETELVLDKDHQEVELKKKEKKSFLVIPLTNQLNKSEAKITKTLAIIMGVFVACWLPFFTVYIIRSQLNDPNSISANLMDLFIWLGYFNSALNPILYAILNRNFRIAFKDILECKCFRKRNTGYNAISRIIKINQSNFNSSNNNNNKI